MSYHAKDFKTLHAGIAIWKFFIIPCFVSTQWRNRHSYSRDSFHICVSCTSQYCVEVLVWMSIYYLTYCNDGAHGFFFLELEFFMVQPKFLVVFLFLINKTINYYCILVAVCLYLYGHNMNATGEKVKVLKCWG